MRLETPGDEAEIFHVNEEAFGQKEETAIVDKLRNRGLLTLSLVAVQDGVIVGHIGFSPVKVEAKHSSFEAIALAPMAVLPAYQHKGIGSQLVAAGLKECRMAGQETVVVLGHPYYYSRFGCVSAKPLGIGCEFDVPEEAFMILELYQGALAGQSGIAKYQPEFRIF